MSRLSFGDAEYAGKKKTTKREIFLAEMEEVVPWTALLSAIEPYYPVAGSGRQPYSLASMLRIHLMQNWFGLSDPGMEEALYEVASMRQFARLSLLEAIPDETTISNFRRLLENDELSVEILVRINAPLTRKGLFLKRGPMVDATIISAPASTKNESATRAPELHQTKKGNQWYFGMKAHSALNADTGLVHTVTTTPANESDVAQVDRAAARQGDGGARRRGLHRSAQVRPAGQGGLADRAQARVGQEDRQCRGEKAERVERRKVQIRARVEHPFRVEKCQFCYTKTRFEGLMKNTAQIVTLFALANLYLARRQVLAMKEVVRPQFG